MLGLVAGVMLIICFIPLPIYSVSAEHNFDFAAGGDAVDMLNITGQPGMDASAVITLENAGNTFNVIVVSLIETELPENWTAEMEHAGYAVNQSSSITIQLNTSESAELTLTFSIPHDAENGTYSFNMTGMLEKSTGTVKMKAREKTVALIVRVGS